MLKKYNGQIISFRFKKSNNITHFTEFLLNIVKTSSLLRGTRHHHHYHHYHYHPHYHYRNSSHQSLRHW